jgi:hypothetical protein
MVYNSEWFYPIHYTDQFELNEIDRFIKPNTVGVHLWNKSWTDELQLLSSGEYKRGFRLAFKRIIRTPFLPFKYYKKIVKYMFSWMFGR